MSTPRVAIVKNRFRAGFTLVEMIVSIVVIAVMAVAVTAFLRNPMVSYQDAQRRASLTDTVQTAFSYFSRDLQTALPNSVRVPPPIGGVYYLEFLKVRTGGRYRAAHGGETAACPTTGTEDGDVLVFGVEDTCFRSLGDIPNLASIVTGNDYLVVYNLGTAYDVSANAYQACPSSTAGCNKSLITAVSASPSDHEDRITFQSNTFTLDSPAHRFQVVSGPVSYICNPSAGTLTRISGYPISATQQTPPAGGTTASLIASGAGSITACTITYDVVNERTALVSMWLTLKDPAGSATVNLFQQVQVSNVP